MAKMIDEDRVRRIAHLARLDLSDDEVRQYSSQLADILNYVQQLDAVNTEGVEPLVHALPLTDVCRADEPHSSLPIDQALSNAPQREGDFFKVPAVLDNAGGA